MSTSQHVILVNLGTPKSTSTSDIREFLRMFLSDKRVVNIPRILWLPILYGFILPFRPKKLVEAYESIWTEHGSPLEANMISLVKRLNQQSNEATFHYCFRYGAPSITSVIAKIPEEANITVLPLFPQYSSTTSASVFDALSQTLSQLNRVPSFQFIADYHAQGAYIKALAQQITGFWEANGKSEHLLLSYHGLPKQLVEKGDPYLKQCQTTTKLLAKELNLESSQFSMSFQSRFGPSQWLTPYTDDLLQDYAKTGMKTIDITCPGFPSDCLETLEEINIGYKEVFLEAGGREYRYIPALNDTDIHLKMIKEITSKHFALHCTKEMPLHEHT